ncbi:MAG: MgtC/SapB family protein [Candidatus Harrisonbacteria bacterium]|nr:MgtC/SapB family protein [Candidatus Harrisonbacteria bacterium]
MDFFDPKTVEIFRQLFFAVLLGSAIGVERELAHKSAGMRTHALVALGSTLFTIISQALSGPYIDPTRIAAQIVTGIGFLGAGLIVFHGERVQGLTTAAGVWVASAIGMALGFHMYTVSIFTTVLTILVFAILWPIERKFVKRFAKEERKDID